MLILVSACIMSSSYAQWKNNRSDGEFEEPLSYSSTRDENGRLTLVANKEFKMLPIVLVEGLYFCDETATITFSFYVNGAYSRYQILGTLTADKECYVFPDAIWSTDFLSDFKKAEKCSIMVASEYCENTYFHYNFTGSTSAYNFVTK